MALRPCQWKRAERLDTGEAPVFAGKRKGRLVL